MANIADVANAVAARKQLSDGNSLQVALSPGSPRTRFPVPNEALWGDTDGAAEATTDTKEGNAEFAVFEVHGKTVKVSDESCRQCSFHNAAY